MPRDLRRRLEEHLQCNLRQSGSSPSSKFDARQDTDRGRLYGCRLPVGGGRSTCIKVQSCLVVIVVTSAPPIPFGSKNGAFTCGFAYVQPHVFDYAADVRAPNITGSFTVYTRYFENENANEANEASGAFSIENAGGSGESYRLANNRPRWTFMASRSSSRYGEYSTVQPASLRLLPCIKT